jgi:hypothetical protein
MHGAQSEGGWSKLPAQTLSAGVQRGSLTATWPIMKSHQMFFSLWNCSSVSAFGHLPDVRRAYDLSVAPIGLIAGHIYITCSHNVLVTGVIE